MLPFKRLPRTTARRTHRTTTPHAPETRPCGVSSDGVPSQANRETDFTARYKRRLLTLIGASDDVELAHVMIFNEYIHDPYTGYGTTRVKIAWREKTPKHDYDFPDNDGMYLRHDVIEGDSLVTFLDSLEAMV